MNRSSSKSRATPSTLAAVLHARLVDSPHAAAAWPGEGRRIGVPRLRFARRKAVQAKRDALLAALAKIGVERADIKLSFLTMNPIYERSSDSWEPTRVHTYRAEITITATTRKFDQLGAMMDAAAGARP